MHTVNRREFGRTVAAAVAVQGAQTKPRPAAPNSGSLTDVPGIKVGHFTDTRRPTGCTAILFDSPAAAGVDYNGSAPGESQVVLLQPVSPVERIHGLLLSGGGLLALPAAGGVLRYLEERKIGFDWGNPGLRIPIVVTAVIDDLSIGDPKIRPDADAAYKACAAASASPVAEGNVGAGAGATVGKMHRGRGLGGMKGGLGTASLKLGDVVIAALAVVNAAGDVRDWRSGRDCRRRPPARRQLCRQRGRDARGGGRSAEGRARRRRLPEHDAGRGGHERHLDEDRAHQDGDDGELRRGPGDSVYHTTGDGDQLFRGFHRGAGAADVPLTVLGSLAADVLADAIVRGVRAASGIDGWPAASGK